MSNAEKEFQKWWENALDFRHRIDFTMQDQCKISFEAGRASMLAEIKARWPSDEQDREAYKNFKDAFPDMSKIALWLNCNEWIRQNLFKE